MIRDNKVIKYFLYAIGEIILVVIGILIALSINNSNELKKTRNAEKVYLKEINKWLLFHLKNKNLLKSITLPQSDKIDSFYLNNSKLKKRIKIKININYLKKECLKLSKKLFLKKN